MTEDKILAYLNLNKVKIDKSLMKIVFWFDFSFTVAIIIFGLLLNIFKFEIFDYVFLCGSIVSIVFFAFWLKIAKNAASEITFSTYVLFISTFKLFYGYVCFSNLEKFEDGYPRFGYFHLIALLVFLSLAFHMCLRFYQIFRDLKTQTIEQARKNIEKKQSKILWAPLFIGSPMVLVKLIKGEMIDMKLGIGFCFWVLTCIWLFFLLMLVPKYVVTKKYKIANILSKKNETGDGSLC